jgi:hypothetical protein
LFASLLADCVGNSFLAACADSLVVFGVAGKDLAVAHLNITAMRFDVGLTLLSDVVYRN